MRSGRQQYIDEYNALVKNKTWSLVPLPPNRRPDGCKWVFKLKRTPDGSISRFKAPLAAKGFNQQASLEIS